MISSRSIPNIFEASQASLFNSTASLDGNKSEISPSAIPNILALPAILPAVLSLPASVAALLGPNDFPDIPLDVTLDLIPGFPLDITSDLPLDFPPGLEALEAGAKGGVVEADAGVPVPGATGATGAGSAVGTPYFHPSHLEADPNFGAEGRAVNVPDVALAFTLGAVADSVTGGSAVAALGVVPSHLKVAPGFGANGRAVNILGVAPALGAALGALVALGEALAALSLAAL